MPPPGRIIYPLNQTELVELKKKLTELLKENKIQVSDNPYGPLIVFVKKNNERLRLYIDYHTLNKNIISDSYLLLYIEELLSQLKDAHFFFTLTS